MTTRKPDGYCAWHPERGFNVLVQYEERFNGIPLTGGGYVRPYYAISPADYDAAIREAEERAWEAAREYREECGVGIYKRIGYLADKYDKFEDWRKSRGEE